MAVALSFGYVRPIHAPLIRFARSTNPFYLFRKKSFSLSRNWSSRTQASLKSSSVSDSIGAQVFNDQSEIIFVGTGTSEGIPRVSCLTNPDKNCPICAKATEPGNKNRRLNTSLLLRFPRPS